MPVFTITKPSRGLLNLLTTTAAAAHAVGVLKDTAASLWGTRKILMTALGLIWHMETGHTVGGKEGERGS